MLDSLVGWTGAQFFPLRRRGTRITCTDMGNQGNSRPTARPHPYYPRAPRPHCRRRKAAVFERARQRRAEVDEPQGGDLSKEYEDVT